MRRELGEFATRPLTAADEVGWRDADFLPEYQGDFVRYNIETEEFVMVNRERGIIRTYMKPDNGLRDFYDSVSMYAGDE